MNKKARVLWGSMILLIIITSALGISLVKEGSAYSQKKGNITLSYDLITEGNDIAGRHYTPNCSSECHLTFKIKQCGAGKDETISKNDFLIQTNFKRGNSKLLGLRKEYLAAYNGTVKDYSTVCLSYNTTDGFEGNWTHSYFSNCTQVESGSHIESRQKWEELNSLMKLADCKDHYVDIIGNFKFNSNSESFEVDIIPSLKIQGNDYALAEMAWWTGQTTNKKHLISLNQTTNATIYNMTFYINSTSGYKYGGSDSVTYAMVVMRNLPLPDINGSMYLYRNTPTNSWYSVNGSEDNQEPMDCIQGSNCTNYTQTLVYPDYQFFMMPFPEVNGTTLFQDRSQSQNNFTAMTVNTGAGGLSVISDGIIGNGIALNAYKKDWLNSSTIASNKITTDMTLIAWVKGNGMSIYATSYGGIVMDGVANSHNTFQLVNDASGNNRCHWDFTDCGGAAGTGRVAVANALVEDGTWHQLACTHNGATGNTTIYLDGNAIQSKICAGSSISSSGRIEIGYYGDRAAWWNGSIDEVEVYNRSLTDAEILAKFEFINKSLVKLGAAITLPFIQNISIAPATAYTNSQLNCSANYGDADADKGNVTITWYNGSDHYSNVTILNVISGQLVSNATLTGIQVKAEVWNCTINATDSQGGASVPNSTTRTISNSIPVIDTAVVMNVTSATKMTHWINMSSNSSDADSDARRENFRWYINNLPVNTTSFISNRTFVKNDVLIAEMWVNDSENANSTLTNSTSLTIGNSAPPSVTLYFNDTNTSDTTPTFNWSKSSDADSDILTYNLEIYNDTAFDVTFNRTLFKITSQNYTLVSGEALSEGIYYWRVLATDNSSNSSWSNNFTLTVDMIAPTIDLIKPVNNSAFTSVSANCIETVYFNFTAADPDLKNCSVVLNHSFYGWLALDSVGVTGLFTGGDGNRTVNCQENASIRLDRCSLGDDFYTFFVYANDTAGNLGRNSTKFDYKPYSPPTGAGGSGGGGGASNENIVTIVSPPTDTAWVVSPSSIDKYFFFPVSSNYETVEIRFKSNIGLIACMGEPKDMDCSLDEKSFDYSVANTKIPIENPDNRFLAQKTVKFIFKNKFNQVREVDGQIRIINLGVYLPIQQSPAEGIKANTLIFAVENGIVQGIRYWVILGSLTLIFVVIKFVF